MVKPEIVVNVERWRKGWRRKSWLRKKLVTLAIKIQREVTHSAQPQIVAVVPVQFRSTLNDLRLKEDGLVIKTWPDVECPSNQISNALEHMHPFINELSLSHPVG